MHYVQLRKKKGLWLQCNKWPLFIFGTDTLKEILYWGNNIKDMQMTSGKNIPGIGISMLAGSPRGHSWTWISKSRTEAMQCRVMWVLRTITSFSLQLFTKILPVLLGPDKMHATWWNIDAHSCLCWSFVFLWLLAHISSCSTRQTVCICETIGPWKQKQGHASLII